MRHTCDEEQGCSVVDGRGGHADVRSEVDGLLVSSMTISPCYLTHSSVADIGPVETVHEVQQRQEWQDVEIHLEVDPSVLKGQPMVPCSQRTHNLALRVVHLQAIDRHTLVLSSYAALTAVAVDSERAMTADSVAVAVNFSIVLDMMRCVDYFVDSGARGGRMDSNRPLGARL